LKLWISVADKAINLLVTLTLALVLASAIVSAVSPVLLKVAIDHLSQESSRTVNHAPYFFVCAYAFSCWTARSLMELRGLVFGRVDAAMQRRLSITAFRHIMSLPLAFHVERRTGALNQILTNGIFGFRLVVNHSLLTILPGFAEFIIMGVVLVALEQTFFLGVIGASVFLYGMACIAGAVRTGQCARDASEAQIDSNAAFTDSVLNYETVKYFGADEDVHTRVELCLAKLERLWNKLGVRKAEYGFVASGILTLTLVVCLLAAAREVKYGRMSVGEFVLVNTYALQISRPLEMIGFAFRDIAQGLAFIERIWDLINRKQNEGDAGSRRPPVCAGCEFVFENVSFSYRSDQPILENLSFVVPSGRTVAVVGISGSGKSSLIRLLARLVEPTGGQIYLNREPLSRLSVSALRNVIAVVPQDTVLFNETIAFNIGFGSRTITKAKIIEAAKIAHIHESIVALPHGYDTVVGERGLRMSGGERQRIAIARAIAKEPQIFVFDEATSSLDSTTERAIWEDLSLVAEGTTTLTIAHRLSTIVHADEIVVLDGGKIAECGTHASLLRLGGLYAGMWRTQNG
jgi:ATP-binding cassette subfamily B protein